MGDKMKLDAVQQLMADQARRIGELEVIVQSRNNLALRYHEGMKDQEAENAQIMTLVRSFLGSLAPVIEGIDYEPWPELEALEAFVEATY